jgi:hypothetical protein
VAAYHGYFGLIKNSNNLSFSKYTMACAARNGHLEIIKWLHQNRTEGCTTDAIDFASKGGYLG